MAVNAIGTAASALQQQMVSERQAQYQPAEKSQPRDDAPQARETQQSKPTPVADRDTRDSDAERTERSRQSKPVVNAQGQKTGTIINTTA